MLIPIPIPKTTPTLRIQLKKAKQRKRPKMAIQQHTKPPWNNYSYNNSLEVKLQEVRRQRVSSLVHEAYRVGDYVLA